MSKISVTTIAGLTSGSDANKVKIESGDTLEVVTNATVGGTLGVTGDLTVDTDTLFVDASADKVGIGTATPLRLLHVSSAGDTGLMLQTTSAVDDKEIWEIQAAADASNHANLIVRTRVNAGTGGSEAIRINNNGVVTKPNNPAFVVYGTQASPASGSVLIFNTEKFDIGNNYNNTNGRFTAPVAGIYIFYCTQIGPNRNSVFRYYTRLNGNPYPVGASQMRLNPGAAIHDYGTSAIMVQMAASDYVDVLFNADDGGVGHGSSTSGHEIFSGYLVG